MAKHVLVLESAQQVIILASTYALGTGLERGDLDALELMGTLHELVRTFPEDTHKLSLMLIEATRAAQDAYAQEYAARGQH